MAHRVKCYYCGLTFDRDKEVDCVAVNQRRYAHLECHIRKQQEKTQEEKDLEALEEYIMQLLQVDYITPRVRKQINDFKAQYNYTYTGMRKALAYFYEVKKNSTEKANGGIAIVEWVYGDAMSYYSKMNKYKKMQESTDIKDYITETQTLVFKPKPIQKPKGVRLFNLD